MEVVVVDIIKVYQLDNFKVIPFLGSRINLNTITNLVVELVVGVNHICT